MVLGEPVADFGPLLGSRFSRILVGLDDEVCFRGLRPVLPDLIDRIALHRDQLCAAAGKGFLRLLYPVARVQPWVVADAGAFRSMLLEPLRGARLRNRLVAPLGWTDLLPDLERIAAVDEDRCFLGKHDCRPGGALETGQPGKTLGIAPDIFTHMLVGERDNEAVELLGLELLA